MGQYEINLEFIKTGVVSGKDMTTEAVITKLMFLLEQGATTDGIKMYLI